MKDMGYRRLGISELMAVKVNLRPDVPILSQQIKGHEGIDFRTFLDQIMSSVMAGKEGGCE